MKIKRYKKAERYMSLFKNNFGFREPYQVLLDGTFCQVALAHKVNIQDQLPRYLSGQCKLLTTTCVVEETKRLGKPLHGAYLVISQFPLHNCGHEEPVSASKCLSSFIINGRNKDHYLVATQDHSLRNKIAKHAICPLIKLANNALVMEKPPPEVIKRVSRRHDYIANKLKRDEISNLEELKKEKNIEQNVEPPRKKRKGPKGPNPLSCRKKTKTSSSETRTKTDTSVTEKKRRRRRKVHIARHVKKFLQEVSGSVEETKQQGTSVES